MEMGKNQKIVICNHLFKEEKLGHDSDEFLVKFHNLKRPDLC